MVVSSDSIGSLSYHSVSRCLCVEASQCGKPVRPASPWPAPIGGVVVVVSRPAMRHVTLQLSICLLSTASTHRRMNLQRFEESQCLPARLAMQ